MKENRILSCLCHWLATLSFSCAIFLPGCKPKAKTYEPVYLADSLTKKVLTFGIPNISSYQDCDLLIKYLNKNLTQARIRMVACKDANDYQEKIKNGYFDFTIINGPILLEAIQNGYSVVAKMGDDDKYKSVIFVRKDSAIRSIADLKGKTIATSNPQALAGTMMPLLYLYKKGLNVNKDIGHLYSPSFESALMNVYFGKCAAGASKKETVVKTFREKPEIAGKLAIMWETPRLVNNAVLIKNTMDATIAGELTRLIVILQDSEEGKKALIPLGVSKFEKANAATYKPLQDFMKEYEAVIR